MKKLFTLFIVLLAFTSLWGKSMYLPTYYSRVAVEDNTECRVDTAFLNQLSVSPSDERFTITVLQDSLTPERIKAIKRMKAAVAFSAIGAVAGSVAAVTSAVQTPLTPFDAKWQAINYTNSVNATASSTYLAMTSSARVADLQHLPIFIIFRNNTNREMYINDLARGLIWYIRANGELMISVGNPEINRFRIAYADSETPQPAYAVIETYNEVEHVMVNYQDENYIYYNEEQRDNGREIFYILTRKDLETGERKRLVMNYEQYNLFRKEQKKK